jgi:hypothetical protein
MTTDRTVRGELREILKDAAKEMGFAVDSIRNEVIEKGWFGQELTPDVQDEWLRDDQPDAGIEAAQDFSRKEEVTREDLYGNDAEISRREENDHDLER